MLRNLSVIAVIGLGLTACQEKQDEIIIVGPYNIAGDSDVDAVIEDSCRSLKLEYVAHDTFADQDGGVSIMVRCTRIPM